MKLQMCIATVTMIAIAVVAFLSTLVMSIC